MGAEPVQRSEDVIGRRLPPPTLGLLSPPHSLLLHMYGMRLPLGFFAEASLQPAAGIDGVSNEGREGQSLAGGPSSPCGVCVLV